MRLIFGLILITTCFLSHASHLPEANPSAPIDNTPLLSETHPSAGLLLEYDTARGSLTCVRTPQDLENATGLSPQAVEVRVRDNSGTAVLFKSFGCSLYHCVLDNETTILKVWSDLDFSADNWCLTYDCDSCRINTTGTPFLTLTFTADGVEGKLSMDGNAFISGTENLPPCHKVLDNIANYNLWQLPDFISGYLAQALPTPQVKEFTRQYIQKIEESATMNSDPLSHTYLRQSEAFFNFFLDNLHKTLDIDDLKKLGELSTRLSGNNK